MMNKTKQTNPCMTFTVRTPSGGLHLYFKLTGSNSDDNAAVAGNLTNRTKFRGAGLDVRAEGGYVVAPPSVLDCKACSVVNNTSVSDMPDALVRFLLEGWQHTPKAGRAPMVSSGGKTTKTTTADNRQGTPTTARNSEYVYCVTDEEFALLLASLPKAWCDHYSDWLCVTAVCKNLGRKEAWETWSKQSKQYNKQKNEEQWQYNNGCLDVNYLVWRLLREGRQATYFPR